MGRQLVFLEREKPFKTLQDVHDAVPSDAFCNLMQICEDCDVALSEVVNMAERIRVKFFADMDAKEAAKVGGEV